VAAPRLLLVEDYDLTRTALARRLRKSGFDVAEAATGHEVLPMVEETHIGVVLLDIRLPDVDGLTILRRLREKYTAQELPVMILSAEDGDVVVQAFALGANDYIVKPVDFDLVVSRLRRLLRDGGPAGTPTPRPAPVVSAQPTEPAEVPDPEEIPRGSTVGTYSILGVLGRGGMGVVYEALELDSTMERRLAVKVLHRKFMADSRWAARFSREAQAAARIEHANIVHVYSVGTWQGRQYIAMHLVDGDTSASLVRHPGGMPWRQATEIVRQCCLGLEAAHGRGVLHRDIKPENIMLGSDGVVKVLDFGLAALQHARADDPLTQPGFLVGTPYYMSPEQIRGWQVDPRTDIYQLGATYYYLLTGQTPFHYRETTFDIMLGHCMDPTPDPIEANPEVPGTCSKIVLRAMEKSPEDRYASASAMHMDLVAALGDP
jgi:serine/threonine protein kinase